MHTSSHSNPAPFGSGTQRPQQRLPGGQHGRGGGGPPPPVRGRVESTALDIKSGRQSWQLVYFASPPVRPNTQTAAAPQTNGLKPLATHPAQNAPHTVPAIVT